MGRRELLAALEREGQEALATLAAGNAIEEGALRTATEERLTELRRQHETECQRRCDEQQRTLLAKAEREAGLIRLRAEHTLGERLHERARLALAQLDAADPERLFAALAAELPDLPWQSIRVNPGDTLRAGARFPGAEIIADPDLSGGLKVETAAATLTVDNTLETRLERLWPELLPQLLAELRGQP